MREFKVDDVVSVSGYMDGITFKGEVGVLRYKHREKRRFSSDNYIPEHLWAVEFESRFRIIGLHSCLSGSDKLPKSTGYFVREKLLTKIIKDSFEEDGQE